MTNKEELQKIGNDFGERFEEAVEMVSATTALKMWNRVLKLHRSFTTTKYHSTGAGHGHAFRFNV
jgi:hypothetical protein